jgi:condensin complex subunit 2
MAAMADKENAGGTLTDEEKKNMQIRCLHCARDNTITTKNTWAMDLIDYLPELVSPEDGQQTNFQRASVTLDAGVKIYSYRVDSVHTETFKILGGLGRASNPTDDEDGALCGHQKLVEGRRHRMSVAGCRFSLPSAAAQLVVHDTHMPRLLIPSPVISLTTISDSRRAG